MWRTAPPFSYCEEECAVILALGNPSVKSKNIFSRHISFFLGGSLLNLKIFRIPLLFFSFYFASVMPLFRVVDDTKPVSKAGLFVSYTTPTAIANKYFRVVDDTKTGATKLFSCRPRHQKFRAISCFRVVHDTKKPEGRLGYNADAINFVSLATPN